MRGYSVVELLVVVAAAGTLISMFFFFRWDDTERELIEERIRSEATKELWMMRIDEPMPDRGIWEWEDENGDVWVMFRDGSNIHNMGDIELP